MAKKSKAVKKILLVILVLIILAAILVYSLGNQVLKAGIEKAASKALNVGVTIDDIGLSILRGKVEIEELIVDNPPGYELDKLLEVADARIAVSIGSLLGDTVNVKEIIFDGIDISIEQKGLSNNLKEVIDSIPKSEKKTESQTEKPGKKLHIDILEITNVTVKLKLLPVPGKANVVPLKLAPIRMTDLGGDNKMDTAKLAGKILLAITKAIAEQGGGFLPEGMGDSLGSAAKSVEEGKKALEEGTEAGKKVIEGLKGLFEPKK